jgi:5-methylcytosine-specific restriction endonuclease McrA
MKRKSIPKNIRQQVYEKYDGHCAYCGCELEYKDMQVDHLDSVYRADILGQEPDNSIDNLMPSCRQCNFYKGTMSVDEMRKRLETFEREYLLKNFDVRLGIRYGMLSVKRWNGLFYFEENKIKI